jgi:hypothetical protein
MSCQVPVYVCLYAHILCKWTSFISLRVSARGCNSRLMMTEAQDPNKDAANNERSRRGATEVPGRVISNAHVIRASTIINALPKVASPRYQAADKYCIVERRLRWCRNPEFVLCTPLSRLGYVGRNGSLAPSHHIHRYLQDAGSIPTIHHHAPCIIRTDDNELFTMASVQCRQIKHEERRCFS